MNIIERIADDSVVRSFVESMHPSISLEGCYGSLGSFLCILKALRNRGIYLVVAEDRESASFFYNDIYNILEELEINRGSNLKADDSVMLLPTAYKRSILSAREDNAGIALRTAALSAIATRDSSKPLIICTYPEAISEKVASREALSESILKLRRGDKVGIPFIEQMLQEYGFVRTDFVSQPGQYAVRGGIVDVFSFADNKPYRVELFGDEVESLRTFVISTQLSDVQMDSVEIVPNLKDKSIAKTRVSLVDYIGEKGNVWISSPNSCFDKLDTLRSKLLSELDEPSEIDNLVTSGRQFLSEIKDWNAVSLFGSIRGREGETFDLRSKPQPVFNKNFELLVSTLKGEVENGIENFILSDNIAQQDRIESIVSEITRQRLFESVKLTIHAGFFLGNSWYYTDHQIFDRYHKYTIHNEIDKSGSLTLAELNMLKVGDFVVHTDHGVGKFGGLVRTVEGGKRREFIKLTYRDGDVLMVAVHNLHRISRYKSGEAEIAPSLHKLGGNVWSKLKETTKRKVKDIARELIELYAKRKASEGFAYSPDTYLQNELEASFMYEDTPDQMSTTNAVKADMESSVPMDRLVCGDVGFGKTEIAIRAAFKAATDGKQVAILVPTTVLSLQHYRTFKKRLKEFPVVVENLSRVKSAKQTGEILQRLREGKIDILIGTHKILSKTVEFRDLGLLIIDEEQKFGVANKEKLRSLKANIDTLTLTATPIPRTLQFSLMGARDMSVINTPPPNRQPVATEVHALSDDVLHDAIEYEVARGGQVFVLHNRVGSIEAFANKIRNICPGVKVAVGHGQMPPAQLEDIMTQFIFGEFDVFVATTIIESGIDIPNANTIIINNAHMFGLSDLHQLRGRVGRSNRKAFCYLLVPSFETITGDAGRRLRAIEEFSDLGSGFSIAMQDLDIRGAGNILGGEQSGFIADIGYETYQKIITEAINELKIEQGLEVEIETSDTVIESDTIAYLPDEYIGSTAEKLRLYRMLDSMKTVDQLDNFAKELKDRFGELPNEATELVEVVKLRVVLQKMAVDKAVVKNGIAILHFNRDHNHPYYKTTEFDSLLKRVLSQPSRYKLNQTNHTMSLVIRQVATFADVRNILTIPQ